jgi:hypothetical protein
MIHKALFIRFLLVGQRSGDLPLGVIAVADHQPPAVLIHLVSERVDVSGDLGMHFPIFLVKVRPSRRPAEGHPQVLIIALAMDVATYKA